MVESIIQLIAVNLSLWNAGFYFENFGKGSMLENYLETLLKV